MPKLGLCVWLYLRGVYSLGLPSVELNLPIVIPQRPLGANSDVASADSPISARLLWSRSVTSEVSAWLERPSSPSPSPSPSRPTSPTPRPANAADTVGVSASAPARAPPVRPVPLRPKPTRACRSCFEIPAGDGTRAADKMKHKREATVSFFMHTCHRCVTVTFCYLSSFLLACVFACPSLYSYLLPISIFTFCYLLTLCYTYYYV